MIEIQELTKRYGSTLAVDHLTFTVHPGRVTGFLGPNGSGKSTTMRLVLGLDSPTSGRSLVNGRAYAAHAAPLTCVGSLLEQRGAHPGRSVRGHLEVLAATHGVGRRRIGHVLDQVGLTGVSGRRAGHLSLGMSQRLGIAAALLGDPEVVLLDEPVNGLDPDGVRWIRGLLRGLATEGRTVLVSSHLLSEMAQTADHVVVIGRGGLVADVGMTELIARSSRDRVLVRSPDAARLGALLARVGADVGPSDDGRLQVSGVPMNEVGELARRHDMTLHELTLDRGSLEDAFLGITRDVLDYDAQQVTP